MRGEPDEPEDTAEESSPQRSSMAANPPSNAAPGQNDLTSHPAYALGLKNAHDYLRGQSQTNPFAGKAEYGDLANGNQPPVAPVPVPSAQRTIGTSPENIGGAPSAGMSVSSMLPPTRNLVKETVGAPASATNEGGNFPAGIPRAPSASPTPAVGGQRAVPSPSMPNRIQKAVTPSTPQIFGG